jgi:hypothetical protein
MPIFLSPKLENKGKEMFFYLVLQGMAKHLCTTVYVTKMNQLVLQKNL